MTPDNGTTGLRINKLEIESFLKIRHCVIDAQGRHVVAHGPNFVGKSTILKSIWAAISGLSAKQFPEPIHHGETKARIHLDLGEFVIERKITASGGSLTVTRADGTKIPNKPQAFLDSLFRELSLDPVAFVRLKPLEQIDTVLGIAGVKPPVARVTQITGEEQRPYPNESAYDYLMRLSQDNERGLYYLRRREKGREVDQKQKAILEQREQLNRLGGPLRPDEQERSAAELNKQIDALRGKADQRRAVEDDLADKQREIKNVADKLAALTEKRKALRLEHERIIEQINMLEARKSAIETESGQLADRMTKGQEVKREWEEDAEASEAALKAFPDPIPEIAALRQQLQNVEADNRKTTSRRLAGEQLYRLVRELEVVRGEHEQLDKILEAIRDLRAHLLDGVDLGVEGLEIGKEMLIYQGVPFVQASMAEGYRVGVRLAVAAKPGINVLFVDQGESLDENERAALIEAADEAGMQLWMSEVVRGEKGLNIDVIEEESEAKPQAGELAYGERY